ncbi:hypothetical protein [Achromobacter ruhlandii]|uniref:hypothetical protein n=1 Tax=Achromobacter ruhlandii TaxID=72557 RepID=UPI003BA2018F
MQFHYANSTCGFYVGEVHGDNIPADAVRITKDEHVRAMNWQAAGGIIAGVDKTGVMILQDPPPPTAEQIRAAKMGAVQVHMDAAARALHYDSIDNAITYAEEPAVKRFQTEGQAFRAWRSLVWARCYEILDEVESGSREVPTDTELIAALPEFLPPTS